MDYFLILLGFVATCIAVFSKIPAADDRETSYLRRINIWGYGAIFIALMTAASLSIRLWDQAEGLALRRADALETLFEMSVELGTIGSEIEKISLKLAEAQKRPAGYNAEIFVSTLKHLFASANNLSKSFNFRLAQWQSILPLETQKSVRAAISNAQLSPDELRTNPYAPNIEIVGQLLQVNSISLNVSLCKIYKGRYIPKSSDLRIKKCKPDGNEFVSGQEQYSIERKVRLNRANDL